MTIAKLFVLHTNTITIQIKPSETLHEKSSNPVKHFTYLKQKFFITTASLKTNI